MSFRRRHRRNLDCRHAIELMSEYLDGQLIDRDRVRLERHLGDCPHCVEYLSQLRVTIEAVGRAQVEDLSDEALDDLVEIYRRWRR